MILLDTNVLSALMRDSPDIAVVAWMHKQNAEDVWTSTVTVFEVRFGWARMAAGRKRAALEAAFDGLLREDLADRIALLLPGPAPAGCRSLFRRLGHR
jgi:toxin FitB